MRDGKNLFLAALKMEGNDSKWTNHPFGFRRKAVNMKTSLRSDKNKLSSGTSSENKNGEKAEDYKLFRKVTFL
jgi:hypothetical protein